MQDRFQMISLFWIFAVNQLKKLLKEIFLQDSSMRNKSEISLVRQTLRQSIFRATQRLERRDRRRSVSDKAALDYLTDMSDEHHSMSCNAVS